MAYRNDLERTDVTKGKPSFAVLDAYERTLTGAESTLEKKRAVIAKLRATWFAVDSLPLRAVKFSDVKRWLSEHYAEKSASPSTRLNARPLPAASEWPNRCIRLRGTC